MRVIIAGSRVIKDYELVKKAVADSKFDITEVVCGMASGVDSLGERYAKEHGIPVAYYPAEWDVHGRRAGYIRNIEMAKNADALIAIIRNNSPGTMHMIKEALRRGIKTYIVPM